MDSVTYERRGGAALLTIDRQERRNAIDGPTAELIAAAYDRFARDDDARVLVVTGAGGVAFCAGADLKAIESFAPRMDDPRGPLGISRVISPKPTIAAIVGFGEITRLTPSGPRGSSRRGPKLSIAFRSAPAQNATPPAPVITSTRASSSSAKRS